MENKVFCMCVVYHFLRKCKFIAKSSFKRNYFAGKICFVKLFLFE
jgi:hypothetical protein